MKTREVVTIALGIFALAYFAEWVVGKTSPKQCWVTTDISEDVRMSKWVDCPTEEI